MIRAREPPFRTVSGPAFSDLAADVAVVHEQPALDMVPRLADGHRLRPSFGHTKSTSQPRAGRLSAAVSAANFGIPTKNSRSTTHEKTGQLCSEASSGGPHGTTPLRLCAPVANGAVGYPRICWSRSCSTALPERFFSTTMKSLAVRVLPCLQPR